jgi:hypothetical protein
MEHTILIIIAALGLVMPLLWIIGTVTGINYFLLHEMGKTHKGRNLTINPQLGLTMADGGNPVDKEEKG